MGDEREEIEALLPWHAAGALGAALSRRVEAMLARDAGLRRQYAAVHAERAETIALNEALGEPSARALRTLMAAIDAEPARAAASTGPTARPAGPTARLAKIPPRG